MSTTTTTAIIFFNLKSFFLNFHIAKKKNWNVYEPRNRDHCTSDVYLHFFPLNKNWIHFNLISSWNHIFFLLTIDDRIWNRNIKNNNKWKILQEFYFLLFLLHSIFFSLFIYNRLKSIWKLPEATLKSIPILAIRIRINVGVPHMVDIIKLWAVKHPFHLLVS